MTFTLNPFTVDPPVCGPVTTYSCSIFMGSRTDLCSISEGSTTGTFDPQTGNYQFSSTDMKNFLPGTYVFKIEGTIENMHGSQSVYAEFSLTLVNPCPESTLSLLPSPFADTEVWRREDSTLGWTIADMVTSSTTLDCGLISVEFFNDNEQKSELDSSMFFDDRSGSPSNQFTVLSAPDNDLHEG